MHLEKQISHANCRECLADAFFDLIFASQARQRCIIYV